VIQMTSRVDRYKVSVSAAACLKRNGDRSGL
jgi:hypothetical protein